MQYQHKIADLELTVLAMERQLNKQRRQTFQASKMVSRSPDRISQMSTVQNPPGQFKKQPQDSSTVIDPEALRQLMEEL